MQTFSKMRRNSTYQAIIKYCLLSLVLIVYCCLTDLYVILPPLFGILFLLFAKTLKEQKMGLLFLLLMCLFFIELDKGVLFGSLFLIFCGLYFTFYLPLSFVFQKVFTFKIFCIFCIYLICLIVFSFIGNFSSGIGGILGLSLWYVFLEGLVVWFNESKI